MLNQAKSGTGSGPTCAFCSDCHYSDQCTKFASPDKRFELVKSKRCYKCLSLDHRSDACVRARPCFYCKSTAHHSSLCRNRNGPNKFSAASPPRQQVKMVNPTSTNCCVQMKMALIRFPGCDSRLFADDGSSHSYITTALAKRLKLKIKCKQEVNTTTFGDRERKSDVCDVATISLPTRNGEISLDVLITDHICCPIQKYAIDVESNPVLKLVPLADDPVSEAQEVCIDILVGQDYYEDIIGSERITLDNGMKLVSSVFGYILCGRVASANSQSTCALSTVSMICADPSPLLDRQLERFWSIDQIGIKDDPYERDDTLALSHYNSTVRNAVDEDRIEVSFPFKTKNPPLESNYNQAYRCLVALLRRFKDKVQVLESIDDGFRYYFDNQITEEAPKSTPHLIHYLSHHPVIREGSTTTKVREVFNASAKCGKEKLSLNDCLHRGPVLLHNLVGILLRFRLNRVALSCDVEKAFLQVGLQEPDRDVTRFLWVRDIHQPLSANNFVVYRFRRVPFGVISSPFLLDATVKYHLNRQGTSVAADISSNVYVDNVITGASSADGAVEYYREAKPLFDKISMNLREWFTNDADFREVIDQSHRGIGSNPKVLGLRWNTDTDELFCTDFVDHCQGSATKRKI